MHPNRKTRGAAAGFRAVAPWLLAGLALLAAAGCTRERRSLAPRDLTPAERELATRFVVLERARALALADTVAGNAVLDSLAAAWGDTALAAAHRELPSDHRRLAAFYDLLARLLQAERDSLLAAPARRRLAAPLPEPAPPAGGR